MINIQSSYYPESRNTEATKEFSFTKMRLKPLVIRNIHPLNRINYWLELHKDEVRTYFNYNLYARINKSHAQIPELNN